MSIHYGYRQPPTVKYTDNPCLTLISSRVRFRLDSTSIRTTVQKYLQVDNSDFYSYREGSEIFTSIWEKANNHSVAPRATKISQRTSGLGQISL